MSDFKLKDLAKDRILAKYCDNNPDININAIEGCWTFLKTASDVTRVIENHYSQYGISGGRFSVMMTLYMTQFSKQGSEIIPSEISRNLNITKATLTGLLDGLEKDGLIERNSHPSDRRMLIIKLTSKGSSLMEELVPKHYSLLSKLFNVFGTEELKELSALMNKLKKM